MTNIASENQEFVNSLIGNTYGKVNAKHITFYKTFSGLGLLISKAYEFAFVAIANHSSSLRWVLLYGTLFVPWTLICLGVL